MGQDHKKFIKTADFGRRHFNMTVRENIRLGRPSATDAEVEEAARMSGCHHDVPFQENGTFGEQVPQF